MFLSVEQGKHEHEPLLSEACSLSRSGENQVTSC